MKPQTEHEKFMVLDHLNKTVDIKRTTYDKIKDIAYGSKIKSLKSGKVFECIEIQLKGCLLKFDKNLRFYVSYQTFDNYEVV